MAEGLAHSLKGDIIEAYSAGTEPKKIDPLAVKAMAELGIDISWQRSKHVDEFAGMEFDYVITLCGHAQEVCPFFPGKTRNIHHGFEDPPELAKNAGNEEEALVFYRRVRDEIRSFIEKLPGSVEQPADNFIIS
jgi:Protein-tyrosine-phosphatase